MPVLEWCVRALLLLQALPQEAAEAPSFFAAQRFPHPPTLPSEPEVAEERNLDEERESVVVEVAPSSR
jgi:hypothetical protein